MIDPIDNTNSNLDNSASFATKINAVTPLITLAASLLCIALAARDPVLWDKEGFQFALGTLLGHSATGAYTQR